MNKYPILMTTGPLALSDEVKSEMRFDVDPTSLQFRLTTAFLREVILDMVSGGGTHSVVPISGDGALAVEVALSSFVTETDRPLVCVNGNCGEQILKIMRLRGIEVHSLYAPFDRPFSLGDVAACFEAHQNISHLCFAHCEASTGIVNPIVELVQLAKKYRVKTIVDAVNSFGAVEICTREIPFDVMVTSSDKCIEAPPGVSFVVASLTELENTTMTPGSLILDVRSQWRNFEKTGQWSSIPSTHSVQACKKALELLAVEGVIKRGIRYAAVSDEIVRATERYAAPLLQARVRSPSCVALTSHNMIDTQRDFDALYTHLIRHNVYIDPKFHLKTRSFTIGNMGAVKPTWICLLATAFRSFFQPTSHHQTSH
ncbi:aminotransferase class V-fold PLP-dependent enzyme [Paraburkholderia azotifigens]|uniref:Aminotransferase class V-fold PLP-dependent enzyme n=1 Tax=Paraburkholderia azotifigens TaxID=2057004 RepID=A0ABU9RGT1_9BURK